MVFSSIIFIFTFLPITLILYYISPRKLKNIVLLLASLVFYAWGEPTYIFLMLFTTIIDFFAGLLINKNRKNKNKARMILFVTIALNLLILGYFKYYDFLISNINALFNINIPINDIPLPIGISFYTFQTLSYIIDVYWGKVKVQKSLLSFSLYVTMFPQLVAGPIVKYSDIARELTSRKESLEKFGEGVERFIFGLGKKVLIANNVGLLWTSIQGSDLGKISVLTSWIGIIAYTLQIYFDFSGYSDMAIGLGKMFGFDFCENFNYPYISKSITEFWRRWHISLGTWFREYVYIPLGGNRRGLKIQLRNIFIVWFLTGIWHGASWNFIAWGIYYGVLLLIEKVFLLKVLNKAPKFINHVYTMILVMVGWVFFSNDSLKNGLNYIKVMFGIGNNSLVNGTSFYYLSTSLIILVIALLCSTPIMYKLFRKLKYDMGVRGILIAGGIQVIILVLSIAYIVTSTYNPFLYFRF
ncbi:MBOAT family protein [Clostridium perfringens]|nr:MBOAT family protein [Clostridium perfringens]